MTQDVFSHMQSAVDIVSSSEHPANKIAASLAGTDQDGRPFLITRANYWPDAIKNKIGANVKIGGASGTIHAETACLLGAPRTDGASMFVTDPPCPNCAKNMVEAGVTALYIDHKGFEKDFATRRGEDFRGLSLTICEKAGINVYKIFRKEKRVEIIFEAPAHYKPIVERMAKIERVDVVIDVASFKNIIEGQRALADRRHFALAIAEDFVISAEIHAVAGFTAHDPIERETKYDHFLQPITRVMMTAARHGWRINPEFIFSSRVPTARELVNMVGAGFSKLYLGDDQAARDTFALEALKTLSDAGILNVQQ